MKKLASVEHSNNLGNSTLGRQFGFSMNKPVSMTYAKLFGGEFTLSARRCGILLNHSVSNRPIFAKDAGKVDLLVGRRELL